MMEKKDFFFLEKWNDRERKKKLPYDYYYSYALCDVSFQIIIP